MKYTNNVRRFAASVPAKLAAAATGLVASGAALASPGSAIAGELTAGKADQLLVIGACAILLGVIVVWAYVRRSAK